MRARNQWPQYDKAQARKFSKDLPRLVGNTILNFTLDRWARQGWQDEGFQPWKERGKLDRQDRRSGQSSRALLVKTGALRRSIRIVRISEAQVTVGSDIPYARIHNEGGDIQHPGGTAYIVKKGKAIWVSNAKASSRMKRTKPHKITIPERRFIGRSALLDRRITELIRRQIQSFLSKP
jgi:phage gpG-like protein